jgi:bifunctional DNA-binding transcriptional regulator/antitoxin component of YhaV-PrlF toxin-antitoxin module
MSTVTLGRGGELTLPDDVLRRYGLSPDQPIRIVETRGGLLLVPLGDEPMSPALADELRAWQDLAAEGWDAFPYDEAGEG